MGVTMMLSDGERKILEEMDRKLSAEDPTLVAILRNSHLPRGAKGLALGFSLFLIGMGTLLAGSISKMIPLGIAGFVVALFGVILIVPTVTKILNGGGALQEKSPSKGRFQTRLEDRWDRREFGD
jgi:hypothetical protein